MGRAIDRKLIRQVHDKSEKFPLTAWVPSEEEAQSQKYKRYLIEMESWEWARRAQEAATLRLVLRHEEDLWVRLESIKPPRHPVQAPDGAIGRPRRCMEPNGGETQREHWQVSPDWARAKAQAEAELEENMRRSSKRAHRQRPGQDTAVLANRQGAPQSDCSEPNVPWI